ncbi:MAG: hypothetical protein RBQ71_07625 [Acholeplasmataceae bacterium]|jgi:hypothetical protein|nr:hypothetical protein [Acholeplasmataceae bacterium]
MNIGIKFNFLKRYGFEFKEQSFKNVYNSYFTVYTYSFYNEDGCFTIYNLPQRGEWDYFYSKKFSTVMDDLLAFRIDIYSQKADIWDKARKVWLYTMKKELSLLVDVIKYQIQEKNEFYGIKILI